MKLFTKPPTGPVWDIATQERNWLVWQLKPDRENPDRLVKVPQGDGGDAGADTAADLTLAEALEAAEAFNEEDGISYGEVWGYGVGYLARDGSALITVDLDDCVKDGVPFGRAWEIAQRTDTYAEITVSGTGLRLLMPREGVGQEFISDRDLGDGTKAGLYASFGRYAAISGNCFNGQTELHHDLGPVREALGSATSRTSAETKFEADRKERKADRVWEDHWFSSLSQKDQQDALKAMLKCLEGTPFRNERDAWRDLTYACKDLQQRVYWDVFTPWDKFCQRGRNYDPVKNETFWCTHERSDGDRIRWGSLVKWARENGFDIKPWQDKAKWTEMGRRQVELAEAEAEVLEEYTAPDEDVDLSRAPGLLGAIMERAEARSNRGIAFFGLAGGLVAISALARNRFVLHTKAFFTPTNLLVLCIAPSGAGKEEARDELDEVRVNLSKDPASGSALHTALLRNPNLVIAIDEFGRNLRQVDSNSHRADMFTVLMEAYPRAFKKLDARDYARSKDRKDEVPFPYISGLFTTTMGSLADGLDLDSATGGFLGRMLPLILSETPPLAMPDHDYDDVDIREAYARLQSFEMPQPDSLGDPRFHQVRGRPFLKIEPTPEAMEYAIEVRQRFDDLRSHAPENLAPIWNRANEMALRVAGIVAIGNAAWTDTLEKPVLDLPTLKWAVNLVTQAIKTFLPTVAEHANAGEFDGIRRSILNAVANHAEGDGWTRRTKVLRNTKCGTRPFNAVAREFGDMCDPEGLAWLEIEMEADDEGEMKPARPFRIRLTKDGAKARGE
ncbi:PriCT-2 domain-containing protein [Ruegeria arenilitoris]|uniref:PriCT-2 domain-containing protein n=1 Tax=Ruegeria arenilitoris TaxID=1173585 RepID=UPI00147C374A|nr:PriCT-2 domain-containing protein [Ruegeria arenilitoris]